ncbi:hypothetical protein IFM89_013279 [Coptis chinensis]|uniref:Uncharacterized protein n=1 Tax=Coptis chinensis TaxID=261450 RepID=A0A835IWC6_9MAGN|nr:hypothetical protein IFM89_013279 [Coptis chinensis]
MAEEGSEGSVANSSSSLHIWELHGNSLSSWNNGIPWHPSNPNSNSSCEEDISISNSFTNTSNHSGLSTDESSRQLTQPPSSDGLTGERAADSHLWSKVLLSVGSCSGGLHHNQDVGENFLETLSSKNLPAELFEPAAFDYLTRMDNGWELATSTSYNNIARQLNSFSGSFNLSSLVTDWSIAPPCPEVDHQITQPPVCNMSRDSMHQHSEPDLSQNLSNSTMYGVADSSSFLPCYAHEMKVESQHQQIEDSEALLHKSSKNNSSKYRMGHNSPTVMGYNDKYYYGMSEAPWFTRNLADAISFNGCINKPMVDPQSSRHCLNAASTAPDSKKQNEVSLAPASRSARGTGVVTEGKRKRSEDTSEAQFKKPKHETSTGSSVKVQPPKVKWGDRITTLQQIVSPFGKLLSNPYMKANANKDPWGMLERKGKAELKFDLKSRGLCLVPISCTPQVYRENTGSDYWTPTYRGCLYR